MKRWWPLLSKGGVVLLVLAVVFLAYDDLQLRSKQSTTTTVVSTTTTTLFASCQASTYRGRFVNEGGSSGTIFARMYLTNHGATCSMKGYPQLVPYGPRGLVEVSSIPNNRFFEGTTPTVPIAPPVFVVSPGGSVGIGLAWSDLPSGGGPGSCTSVDRMEVAFGFNGGYSPPISLGSDPLKTCGSIIVSSIFPLN